MKPTQFFSLAFAALSLAAVACGSNDESTSSQDNAQTGESHADAATDAPLPLPTCAAKGGKCGAVVPGACADGTVDPNVSDCGSGQVGASCCVPKAAPSKPTCASVGGACTAVVPGACADGTIDPNADCGGVGATCCVPKAKPTCASLGGTCTAVVPGACANGKIDANADCGGGVGVTCCIAGDGG